MCAVIQYNYLVCDARVFIEVCSWVHCHCVLCCLYLRLLTYNEMVTYIVTWSLYEHLYAVYLLKPYMCCVFAEDSSTRHEMLCLYPPDGKWYFGTVLEETAGM